MISKQEIKFIKSLSQKKYRDEHSVFIIEGEKLLQEAEKSNATILKLYRRDEIGEEAMSRISLLSSPSPVLALIKMEDAPGPFPQNKSKLQMAIDTIKDPGNLGTIIRVADWFGIDDIFLSHGSVEVYNPKCVQATMGSLFKVKVHYVDLIDFIRSYNNDLNIYGTYIDAPSIYDSNLQDRGLIVIGNESHGISNEVSSLIKTKISIPPYPNYESSSESLNIAIATAIVCAEFRRPSASKLQTSQ